MNLKLLACAVVGVIGLAACAQTGGPRIMSKPCPGNSCDLEIRVKMVGGTPRLDIDADELRVARGNRDSIITWKLKDSPDYQFKETSIVPHTGAPMAGKPTTTAVQWRGQIRQLNNSAVNFVVENANSERVSLSYDITVYHKTTNAEVKLDPVIFNEGP